MMHIPTELKLLAKEDMKNIQGELGFCEATIDGILYVITAKKIGFNRPNRSSHVRYTAHKI